MSRVVIYDAGIRALFSNPLGPVAKIVHRFADRIEENARLNIRRTFDSRSGDLEESLHQVPIETQVFHIAVGANATHRGFPYALALETGINPLTGGPMDRLNQGSYPYLVPAVRQSGFRQRR